MRQKNKQSAIRIAAVIFALLLAVGLIFSALEWWTDKGPSTWGKKDDAQAEIVGGMEIEDREDGAAGISFVTTVIPKSQYQNYGIATIAETAVQVKATVTLDEKPVTDRELEWSMPWENPSSSWANGKDVEDYVQLSVSEDTFTATVSCKQAFGEPLTLTAALKGASSTVSNSRTVNYVQRYNNDISAKIVYTNAKTPEANLTWNISGEDSEKVKVPFPSYPLTYDEFESLYDEEGADKGTYAVTITTALSDVYTKAATVTDVKIEFSSSNFYSLSMVSPVHGFLTRNDGQKYLTSQTGSGANATIPGTEVNFCDIFGITSGSSMDWTFFKNCAKNAAAQQATIFTAYLSATVNGTEQTKEINLSFDSASITNRSLSISIGDGDIDFK